MYTIMPNLLYTPNSTTVTPWIIIGSGLELAKYFPEAYNATSLDVLSQSCINFRKFVASIVSYLQISKWSDSTNI